MPEQAPRTSDKSGPIAMPFMLALAGTCVLSKVLIAVGLFGITGGAFGDPLMFVIGTLVFAATGGYVIYRRRRMARRTNHRQTCPTRKMRHNDDVERI